MANNFFIGANAVTCKLSGSFEDLGLTSTNVSIIFQTENGTIKSYKPGRSINSLTAMVVNKGYFIVAKIDFENLLFTPPLLVCPNVTYTKTSTTITAAITLVVGATSYQINYTYPNGAGSLNWTPGDANTVITGLAANTAVQIQVCPRTDTNALITGCDFQTITTDA